MFDDTWVAIKISTMHRAIKGSDANNNSYIYNNNILVAAAIKAKRSNFKMIKSDLEKSGELIGI